MKPTVNIVLSDSRLHSFFLEQEDLILTSSAFLSLLITQKIKPT